MHLYLLIVYYFQKTITMKQFKIFTLLFLALIITSCNKNEDQATGVGDVLVVTKKSGLNTVYGLSFYAYSFSPFQSVTAVSSTAPGKTYTLKSNSGYKTNFYYETPDSEFSTTKPAAATYHFSSAFENGATDEFQDEVSDKILSVPNIEKCEYNPTKQQIELTWTTLTNADSYSMNILDGPTLVFGSTELANTLKFYAVSTAGGGWISNFTPASGKSYTVKLFAFLYEPGGNSYNVQSTSVAETTVIWGQ